MRTAVEKPRKQIYSNYTEEDFEVWKLLYEKQMHNLKGKVVDEFTAGIELLDFNSVRNDHEFTLRDTWEKTLMKL